MSSGLTEKHPGGRPRKFKTVSEMQAVIDAYFAECDARTKEVVVGPPTNRQVVELSIPIPYTVQGLAVALGLTTKGLLDYEAREEFCATVKSAKAKIEANKVVHMLDGDGYGAGYIFDLKHNHGWSDRQQVEHSGAMSIEYSGDFRACLDRLPHRRAEQGSGETPAKGNADGA